MAIQMSVKAFQRLAAGRSTRETRKVSAGGRGRAAGQRGPFTRRSKYNACRTTVDGWTFDSKAEAREYQSLMLRGRLGYVRNLELQPRFPLYLAQARATVGTYVADFRYEARDGFDGPWFDVVSDVKGLRTPLYRLKKKLVEAIYGIQIREVQG